MEAGLPMREQYYLRPSARGLLAWDVDRLIALTSDFDAHDVPLSSIRELDEPWRAIKQALPRERTA